MIGNKNFRQHSVMKRLEINLALNLYMTITKTTIIEMPPLIAIETLN